MFLVQVNEFSFIDAEKIECVFFDKSRGELCVQIVGAANGEHYIVDNDFASILLNNLSAIDGNIAQPQVKLSKLLGEGE